MILARITPLQGVGWTIVAVAVPTVLRLVLDQGQGGIPFMTYLPAILLAALFLGWRYATAVTILAWVFGSWLLRGGTVSPFENPPELVRISLFALTCLVLIYVAALVRRLVQELQEAAEREAKLNLELHHRVKNMLATVSSIATMTVRHSDPDDFIDAFNGRITALSRAGDLLAVGKEVQCDMGRLVETAIGPFQAEGNIEVEGPDVELPRESCMPLSLALYELCTNAAKYGALSVPDGAVKLAWEIVASGRLLVRWQEENGPPVAEKRAQGMGSRLLRAQAGLAEVRLEFWREGVSCEIEIERSDIASG
jgi:two-component sensor histidine kinase